MKTLLMFLIIANISTACYFYFFTHEREKATIPLLHPEKIILLPSKEQ